MNIARWKNVELYNKLQILDGTSLKIQRVIIYGKESLEIKHKTYIRNFHFNMCIISFI